MTNLDLSVLEAWGCRPLTAEERSAYHTWSFDFFTDSKILQDPFVDMTLQLDVTDAYVTYKAQPVPELTFFSFLIWHLTRAVQNHLGFKVRKIKGSWCVLENAPIVVPVAIGGEQRFCELLLQNVKNQNLAEFALQYREQLNAGRSGCLQRMSSDTFLSACFIGNLPNLQFTALNLHWRKGEIECQPYFYFGQRYQLGDRLMMPLAVKLHHACTDPYLLNALITDFRQAIRE